MTVIAQGAPTREQRLYDALKRITKYQSVASIRRYAARDWGLDDPDEAIEYAYENVIEEAKRAIRGMRRP
jgi:hypothetical protein